MDTVTAAGRSYQVWQARAEDLQTAIDVLEEAAQWLTDRGIGQWPLGSQRSQEKYLRHCIDDEEFFLIHDGEVIAGTVIVKHELPQYWPQGMSDGGYVSKLAIRRRYAGQRLGAAMLAWAEKQLAKDGWAIARLDCWADNPALCQYYRDAGYRDVGQVVAGRWRVALFEIPLPSAQV
ncbi:MAG: GNAT family N-acetyltransferase [Phycisphaeraceae bacterium]|nr:GNAT family N-acetyltransferase [Phycisphaeraceae bacterium]